MKKILVVDDIKNVRESCRLILEDTFIVKTAKNAKEAIRILDNTFNLVITDLNMPDYDGLWLARQIKSRFKGKIPVIIMTAWVNSINIADKESQGVDDLLFKPFDRDTLLNMVSKHL
jgi:two-component system NtrC family response regulator